MKKAAEFWAVIPAAGTGSRMQADIPKQYLQLNSKTVIEHTLDAFCANEKIKGIVVAISKQDTWWNNLEISSHPRIKTITGGEERCHSVLNCLRFLSNMAAAEDWVLVHDAARPCISSGDIDHLINSLVDHPVGGLLALPVRDTMKRAGVDNEVCETVNRNGMWHALTPQMFRLAGLTHALQQAIDRNQVVTDDSQAMELTGLKPLLVEGQSGNIKITRKDDLALAELYLR